jgi:hypothetical protein
MTVTGKSLNTGSEVKEKKALINVETNVSVKENTQGTPVSKDGVNIVKSTMNNGKVPASAIVLAVNKDEKEFQQTTKMARYFAGGVVLTSSTMGIINIIEGAGHLSNASAFLNKSFTSTAVFNGTSESLYVSSVLSKIEGTSSIALGRAMIFGGLVIGGIAYGASVIREKNHEAEKGIKP